MNKIERENSTVIVLLLIAMFFLGFFSKWVITSTPPSTEQKQMELKAAHDLTVKHETKKKHHVMHFNQNDARKKAEAAGQ